MIINLDGVLRSRDITLLTKGHIVKAMVSLVVMSGCESWTTEKAESQTIDAFILWCWRRLLRVPWTARKSNQSLLKKINPEYSLKELMLKLKLQYFGHVMWSTDSLEKTEGKRRSGQRRMRGLDIVIDSVDMSLSKPREIVKCDKEARHAAAHGVTKSRKQLGNWTTTIPLSPSLPPAVTWEGG